ncbi:YcxB family protein [Streptomyces brasiliscabiei]|uniref:YcxB family protein n=1 Tax=Streptomyces brasiliscabiei TaxID=2736302 RepID=A0ABU8GIJ0_9ACTN
MTEAGGAGGAAGESVALEYRAALDDYREAVRAARRISAADRWVRWLLWFAVGAGVLVTVLPLVAGRAPDTEALMMLGATIVVLALAPWLQARLIHRREAARGPHRIVLDLWGVLVEHDGGTERTARWSQVSRYVETPRTFVLLSRGEAPRLTVLPKSGLRTPADADRVRGVLAREGLTRL